MYDPNQSRQLYLTQDWDAAWQAVVKPWLSRSDGVHPGYVVVPTRGQARAMRLRMAQEGVISIGARFVTPGLIRRLPVPGLAPDGVVPDRAILEFGLSLAVAEACQRGGGDPDDEGLARSLMSRPSDPLEDWDDLLRVGLDENSFPHPFVRRTFRLLRTWLRARGFGFPYAADVPAAAEAAMASQAGADRALIYGFGADSCRDGPDLVRLMAAMRTVTAVIPFPSFAGKPLEEDWVGFLETALGVESLSLPDQTDRKWGGLARSWVLNETTIEDGEICRAAPILVGQDSRAEVALVFKQIVDWLDHPQVRIAVVFPAGSPAVADLATQLKEAGIRFCDEVATTGAPSGEVGLLKALLAYQRGGCRLEELWALARMLRRAGLVSLTAGQSRDWVERAFDACQSHRVADVLKSSEATRSSRGRLMAELIESIGIWPERLTVEQGVNRLEACAERWGVEMPERLAGLDRLIAADDGERPREAVVDLLAGSLPERAPRQGLIRDDFAPVVLTTRRRATAQVWSHVLFAGSNAEAWSRPPEETFWLSDGARREINRRMGHPGLLQLAEDASILERLGCLDICNNVLDGVAFSACLRVNDGSETDWSPHPWLERILLQRSRAPASDGDRGGFTRIPWPDLARSLPPDPTETPGELTGWIRIWHRRRDPRSPFDAWFYCHEKGRPPARRWAARLLEAGFQDPVVLWYEGVLGLRRIPEGPLQRSRRRELGSLVHRFLALALRGDTQSDRLHPMPEAGLCRDRLNGLLRAFQQARPDDAYWRSFHLELAALARGLLDRVLDQLAGAWIGTEYNLPPDTRIDTSHGELSLSGRIDLVESDRPEWRNALVRINDFKTGGDQPLNAGRMGERGQSLQLGVYLKAAKALGASEASVRMIQPEKGKDSSLDAETLEAIQPAFDRLGRLIHSGQFGQLTPDRSRFGFGFEGPLACLPIPLAVLEQKNAATFPGDGGSFAREGRDPS